MGRKSKEINRISGLHRMKEEEKKNLFSNPEYPGILLNSFLFFSYPLLSVFTLPCAGCARVCD